ncbi:hypothetical protein EYF80_024401 [Liparis tanakae]|uniref:Uncharacterized protein n=1 Tax=Liparis tanakae TaxID=230148 RepID=A0A4Z2HJD6_9TELE|nr:hypothetical protein EYF80_024401 [Liparis tanakae]
MLFSERGNRQTPPRAGGLISSLPPLYPAVCEGITEVMLHPQIQGQCLGTAQAEGDSQST